MKSVRSIVGKRETVTVHSLTSVLETARVMSKHQIGAVPVIDMDGERLAGIFTERDLMARIVAEGRDPHGVIRDPAANAPISFDAKIQELMALA